MAKRKLKLRSIMDWQARKLLELKNESFTAPVEIPCKSRKELLRI